MQKAVFVDRDGTLIEEVNYLSRVADLKLFQFTEEAVRLLKASGYLVIVLTNQSGIGRGIFDVDSMNEIHSAIQSRLSDAIDAFYYCPHLPCDECICRKPRLGMIEAATSDFPIDLANSWFIGDKKIDIETGVNAGLRTAMVKTGYGRQHLPTVTTQPTAVAEDLLEAARFIVGAALKTSDE